MPNKSNLSLMASVSTVVGLVFWCLGFYKYLAYNSGESVLDNPVNVYVGGDAYNYIINGTYFTAFAVIGGVFILSGVLLYGFLKVIEQLAYEKEGSNIQNNNNLVEDELPEL